MNRVGVFTGAAVAFAAATGGLVTAAAIGVGAAAAPVTTETITLTNGATGPAGPRGPAGATGPAGPSGVSDCPTGYVSGDLVINHPGGQVTILT